MKIIYNKIIPFKGFLAINLFGFLFARKKLTEVDINHEKIHTEQMKELLYIPFYILYILEYIIRLCIPFFKMSYQICIKYTDQFHLNRKHINTK